MAEVAAGWWLAAALYGAWLGRRNQASPPIARLLADARMQTSLPELRPGLTLLNRLWPLLLSTLGAAALGLFVPQVSAVAAGFGIIWALAWRRQEARRGGDRGPRRVPLLRRQHAAARPHPADPDARPDGGRLAEPPGRGLQHLDAVVGLQLGAGASA